LRGVKSLEDRGEEFRKQAREDLHQEMKKKNYFFPLMLFSINEWRRFCTIEAGEKQGKRQGVSTGT
jgi:hypothetical protein